MKRKVILYIEVLICVIKNRMQEPVNALGVFKQKTKQKKYSKFTIF